MDALRCAPAVQVRQVKSLLDPLSHLHRPQLAYGTLSDRRCALAFCVLLAARRSLFGPDRQRQPRASELLGSLTGAVCVRACATTTPLDMPPKAPKTASATGWTKDSLRKEFELLGYNMLDCGLAADKCIENASKECKDIKALSHKALSSGRDAMNADDTAKANSNFAFAYQMRCVSDWILVNLLKKRGDEGHAKYLEVSRQFSKLATGKLSGEDKKKIEALIAKIKD